MHEKVQICAVDKVLVGSSALAGDLPVLKAEACEGRRKKGIMQCDRIVLTKWRQMSKKVAFNASFPKKVVFIQRKGQKVLQWWLVAQPNSKFHPLFFLFLKIFQQDSTVFSKILKLLQKQLFDAFCVKS